MKRTILSLFVIGLFMLIATAPGNKAIPGTGSAEPDLYCGTYQSPFESSGGGVAGVLGRLMGGGPVAVADNDPITFNKQVVRIFQAKCQVCHHPGDIAPFSLMSYDEARPYASLIKAKTASGEMPPWKATEGCGDFEGVRRLSSEDIETLGRWVDAGAPEGDPADLPAPTTFDGGWPLGTPDVVLQPEGDYTVQPGRDIYRCFSIPANVRGERFLSAVDLKPGNRQVVHHIILYIDETGVSKDLDDKDPEPGYTSFGGPGFPATGTLGGWAPGTRIRFEPAGNGWRLPEGARIVMQVHYHPHNGQAQTDLTQIGLYFAREPVEKETRVLAIDNDNFAIPPNDPRYRVSASLVIPPGLDAHMHAIFPHMHLLGREMTVEATPLGGSTSCLISVADWDFNWQGFYYYRDPVPLKGGTRISLTAYYDNTVNNPDNPNIPPKTVRYGEQTTDEMCFAFVQFTLDAERRTVSTPQVTAISVDSSNRLVVDGRGFLKGADIEIDGLRVADTVNNKKKKKASKQLLSSAEWKSLAPPGRQVQVRVLNPDGVRSTALSFTGTN